MSYTSDSDAVSGICGLSEGGRKRNWPNVSGLHRNYVGSAERGERNLTVSSLKALAGAFGLTLSELLEGLDQGLKTDQEKALGKIEKRKARIVKAYNTE